jgi:hypothetical protein
MLLDAAGRQDQSGRGQRPSPAEVQWRSPDGVLIAICACGWREHARETAPHGLPSPARQTRRHIVITVEAMHLAPVKSLGLVHPTTVHVARHGIVEDRRLYVVDQHGRLVTQRTHGQLVQVTPQYQSQPEWLTLRFPDGISLGGP